MQHLCHRIGLTRATIQTSNGTVSRKKESPRIPDPTNLAENGDGPPRKDPPEKEDPPPKPNDLAANGDGPPTRNAHKMEDPPTSDPPRAENPPTSDPPRAEDPPTRDPPPSEEPPLPPIDYVEYESEVQMPDIMRLIQKDLSEPYSIYTYRYFIHNWPHLCFMVWPSHQTFVEF